MELKLEFNPKLIKIEDPIPGVMMTPPINEDFWALRVAVSEKQAIVAFPKFTTMGVGFQHEDDWNTNLPYTQTAEALFNHIKHNKGDDSIPDERCIEAIRMIQKAIKDSGFK